MDHKRQGQAPIESVFPTPKESPPILAAGGEIIQFFMTVTYLVIEYASVFYQCSEKFWKSIA